MPQQLLTLYVSVKQAVYRLEAPVAGELTITVMAPGREMQSPITNYRSVSFDDLRLKWIIYLLYT
jgi:hypothetical protein